MHPRIRSHPPSPEDTEGELFAPRMATTVVPTRPAPYRLACYAPDWGAAPLNSLLGTLERQQSNMHTWRRINRRECKSAYFWRTHSLAPAFCKHQNEMRTLSPAGSSANPTVVKLSVALPPRLRTRASAFSGSSASTNSCHVQGSEYQQTQEICVRTHS